MVTPPPSTARLRTACNSCHKAKVRCSGEKSGCIRCRDHSYQCVYGLSRVGKAPGSRRHGRRSSTQSADPNTPAVAQELTSIYATEYLCHGRDGVLSKGIMPQNVAVYDVNYQNLSSDNDFSLSYPRLPALEKPQAQAGQRSEDSAMLDIFQPSLPLNSKFCTLEQRDPSPACRSRSESSNLSIDASQSNQTTVLECLKLVSRLQSELMEPQKSLDVSLSSIKEAICKMSNLCEQQPFVMVQDQIYMLYITGLQQLLLLFRGILSQLPKRRSYSNEQDLDSSEPALTISKSQQQFLCSFSFGAYELNPYDREVMCRKFVQKEVIRAVRLTDAIIESRVQHSPDTEFLSSDSSVICKVKKEFEVIFSELDRSVEDVEGNSIRLGT